MVISSLLFAVLGLVQGQPQVPVKFVQKPQEGDALERVLNVDHLLGLDALVRTAPDGSQERIQMRTRLNTISRLQFIDRMLEVESGRAQCFEREILECSISAKQDLLEEGAPANEIQLKGGVSGLDVLYTWVPHEQAYGRYYTGREERESWLKDLPADLDAGALLPDDAVLVGQSWAVDPLALRGVLAPGGAPQYKSRKGVDKVLTRTLQMGVGGSFYSSIGGRVTGGAKVTLSKVDYSADQAIAHLSVKVSDARFLVDITQFSQSNKLIREDQAGIDSTKGTQLLELTGEGTLLWDLKAGRMISWVFQGRESFRTDIQVTGKSGTYGESAQLSGRVELSFSSAPTTRPHSTRALVGPREDK